MTKQGGREMAEVNKIVDFFRSSDFLTGYPDYEYGSNIKNLVGCGWWMDYVLDQTNFERFHL